MERVSDILDKAAALIEPEGRWTQGVLGRDAAGKILLRYQLANAVCFCAEGAIALASGEWALEAKALTAMRNVIGRTEIGFWNDRRNRTQAEVVVKLREAAALAREQGK